MTHFRSHHTRPSRSGHASRSATHCSEHSSRAEIGAKTRADNPIHSSILRMPAGERPKATGYSLSHLAPVFDLNARRRFEMADARYSPEELAEVAAGLRRLLEAIASGDVTADHGTIARLEGAIVTLEALSKGLSQGPVVP